MGATDGIGHPRSGIVPRQTDLSRVPPEPTGAPEVQSDGPGRLPRPAGPGTNRWTEVVICSPEVPHASC